MVDPFDPSKNAANLAKHGLPLTFGDKIFADENHLILPSVRAIDGEERFKVIGRVEQKHYTAVFVWRNDLPRYISVRRSNKGEERSYHTEA
ncbi:BrnT family toxin [Neogemmobacter tilapiae]|uniref:BrnT family toxin n=1 Tax=Neogemmobacter tilapiae TaxID=875041 RepID=A0A918TSA4_9RHOB|nr:BrnT family toxin [Gemmobacter tilapiae]GHC58753.1 hypothetical protein GCM10007315_23100 [Gemmobacter tilapiae]